VAQLHPSDAQVVRDAIEERMKALGLELDESIPIPILDETARQFLCDEEQVVYHGKMSHLVAEPRPGGTATDVWKPGHLYLTTQRLVWWYDFDGKVAFEMPLDKITGAEVKRKDLGGMLKNKPVLDLVYQNSTHGGVASFSDAIEELNQWQKMIGEIATGHHQIDVGDDTEECPQCGSRDFATKLLTEGCSVCGWVSPRMRREEVKV
jgi:ribosomal protein L37E